MAGIQILLMLIALSVASCELIAVQGDGKSLPIVRIDGREGVRERRQTSRMPIRIMPFYDSTVAEVDASKRDMIQMEIIPNLISFLSNTLSVTPSTNAILLNNQCNDNSGTFFILQDGTGRIACPNQCATVTKCGVYSVQVEHLKQCQQCNGVNSDGSCSPAVGVPSADGAGVANTDFVLYISANQSACPPLPTSASSTTTVAFATHCQLEDSIDRPVAGNVNFCPEGIARNVNGLQYIAAVTKHELLHALGFSSSLFPFWHDQNGNPRTSRTENQFPTMAGTSTIRNFTYLMWQTRGGRVTHTVRSLVTPTVVSAGREHFGCPTLGGVELENQGGSGTAMDHWEKRILGNEAMTGVFTSNPVFSNITLAALYDTGWYDVDFTMAEGLLWGRGQGCNFFRRSCLDIIETQRQSGVNAIFPFCNEAGRLGCTVDRLSVAQCNLVSTSPAPPSYISEYQYFSDSLSRGGVEVTDFCPFYQSVQFRDGRFPVCSQQSSAPSVNNLLESYGMSSRCLTHGRDWVVGGLGVSSDGGGCYQYSCSPTTGVTITVNGEDYTCTCTGEEVIIDMMVNEVAHFGSVICPACQDICHDSLSQCPTSAASVCYGRSVSLNGSVLVDVTNPPTRPSKGVTLAPFLTSLWMVLVSAVQTFYL